MKNTFIATKEVLHENIALLVWPSDSDILNSTAVG